MIETTAPQAKTLRRVCIRCGDPNVVSLTRCAGCSFDLMSDLQRDYDLYRGDLPTDAPGGLGERAARTRMATQPGTGSATWHPYRSSDQQEPAKATMDLGAAVLAAVFDAPGPTGRPALDISALGPLLTPDTTSAIRVEAPVVVGQPSDSDEAAEAAAPCLDDEEDTPDPRVAATVQDWVLPPAMAQSAMEDRWFREASQPVIVATGRRTSPPTMDLSARALPAHKVPTRPELPPATFESDPISRRSHIKDGTTTYVDALQRRFRREPGSLWRRDLAFPLVLAGSAVALLVFILL